MGSAAKQSDKGRTDIALLASELIADQYASPSCGTTAIARRLGVSPSLLCHRFRSAWETTIGREIRRRRIAEARRLLDEKPDRLIKEIAGSVGYVRASYRTFLNAFRAETGMSPTDYQAIASARAQMRATRDRREVTRRTA